MNSEEFDRDHQQQQAKQSLADMFASVFRNIVDGRVLPRTLTVAEDARSLSDGLDTFTVSDWPTCFPCSGTAEMADPQQHGHKALCSDRPHLCLGNQYGRMHPNQLIDYVRTLLHDQEVQAVLPPAAVPSDILSQPSPEDPPAAQE
jgi:hypothetical protein